MRRALAALALLAAALAVHARAFDPVVPGRALHFPRDFGAHPGHRIEWWYVTGQLEAPGGPLGFQVTFFRVRNLAAEGRPGRFNPAQILFAHAALAQPSRQRYLHAERAGRALDGLVAASTADTDVRIDGWSLARGTAAYEARVDAGDFALDLRLAPTQPVLLQGERGYSRKGPGRGEASEYYSEPQLAVAGRVRIDGRTVAVNGKAWLDHEWSSHLLPADASGWDWLGANLDDGSALMAFRMRSKDGAALWTQATLRAPGAAPLTYQGAEVAFRPLGTWKSPHTGVRYPTSMAVRIGDREWTLRALMEDQELDARASTGTLYWEGAVRLAGSATGRGYLELTGYGGQLALPAGDSGRAGAQPDAEGGEDREHLQRRHAP